MDQQQPFFTDDDIVSTYTREQAIEDGVLADLNQWIPVNETIFPTACTSAVFDILQKAVESKPSWGNDYKGLIWDMVNMARFQHRGNDTHWFFKMTIHGAGRQSVYTFKAVLDAGDDEKPVITFLLPDED